MLSLFYFCPSLDRLSFLVIYIPYCTIFNYRNTEDAVHRLISRDRPTKTGRLCLSSPFFFVAALNVRICRVVDGEWGGTISVEENF